MIELKMKVYKLEELESNLHSKNLQINFIELKLKLQVLLKRKNHTTLVNIKCMSKPRLEVLLKRKNCATQIDTSCKPLYQTNCISHSSFGYLLHIFSELESVYSY